MTGVCYKHMGDLERASGVFEGVVQLCSGMKDVPGEAAALGNLGQALAAQKKLGEAETAHTRSLELARGAADKNGELSALFHLGTVRHAYRCIQRVVLAHVRKRVREVGLRLRELRDLRAQRRREGGGSQAGLLSAQRRREGVGSRAGLCHRSSGGRLLWVREGGTPRHTAAAAAAGDNPRAAALAAGTVGGERGRHTPASRRRRARAPCRRSRRCTLGRRCTAGWPG